MKPKRRALVLRRLFSLSGLFPIGLFVVVHLLGLARLSWGSASERRFSEPSKLQIALEIAVIGVPLAFHGLLGARIALSPRSELDDYPFRTKSSDLLMRATGFVALVFVLAHLWQFRVRLLLGRAFAADFFNQLVASLSSTGAGNIPYAAAGYLIALAATSYHLAVGVQAFCARFGLVRSEREYRRIGAICTLGGLILFAIGASSVIHLAAG